MRLSKLAARLTRRIGLRARLTVIYGAMFLVAGVLLLATTYVLFNQQLTNPAEFGISRSDDPGAAPDGDVPPPSTSVVTREGDILTGDDAELWLENQEEHIQDSAVSSLITQGGIALLVVGTAAGIMGWFIAGRVLGPLHQVTDTARRIAAAPAADRGLHERIGLRGPDDEVKELADTFDTMVARLDHSFAGQRRFVANASHELRTPLTLSRGLVELAMHRSSASDDVKRLGDDLLEINTRHERLIRGLLLLAGAENEVTDRYPVDLADVVGHAVAGTAEDAARADVTVHDDTTEAVADGDALLLERLVYNLVENGIRHNRGGNGWLRITTSTRQEAVALTVSNTGPIVPPYDVPHLFEPFRRLGTDRLVTADGAGLGLSIVRSIARTHGGDVSAVPRDEGGLEVTVTLPQSTSTHSC